MSIMNFQNPDEQIKNRIKKEYEKAVQNISFSEDSKNIVLTSISNNSLFKKIIHNINLVAEYEINISVKAYIVGALALFTVVCFTLFQNISISKEDINAAEIHYININVDFGGNNDTN